MGEVHLLMGGPDVWVQLAGRRLSVELHPYLGPIPISRKTGDELKSIPRIWWVALELWERGGRLLRGKEMIVPAWCGVCGGLKVQTRRIGRKHREVIGPCPECDGVGAIFKYGQSADRRWKGEGIKVPAPAPPETKHEE